MGCASNPSLDLLGRTDERARLRATLAEARGSRGRCLVLTGEGGVGKTALLAAAEADAADFRVLHTRGVESEAELPFAGLTQLLRPIVHRLTALPTAQRQALQAALGMSSAEPPDRLTLGAATLGILAAAAVDSPVLAVVDDAHWLDHGSLAALTFTARRLSADPIVMLVATRPEPSSPLEDAGLEQLRVTPLGPGDTACTGRTRNRPTDAGCRP